MSAESQATPVRRPAALALVLAAAFVCAGCGSFSLKKAEVDPTILTGAIGAQPMDAMLSQDQAAIRNVVSALDAESVSADIPWANAQTGSRGVISSLVERTDGHILCRRYNVTRERYDGIVLYRGETCLEDGRQWIPRAFSPVE